MANSRKTAGRTASRSARGPREPSLKDEIAESGETELTDAERAEREQREDHAFLAREFLTWLVYHAEIDGGSFEGKKDLSPFTITFGGKVTLRTPAGLVTDMVLKGPSPVGSPDLRYALAGGLAVKEADLLLSQDDRVFHFGLAAEHFDLKRVKLPELLSEGEEERADERLTLLAQLDAALKAAFAAFLEIRCKPAWGKQVVPAIRAWLDEGT